jgi:Zn ribbon nucleic-acid-binding protein
LDQYPHVLPDLIVNTCPLGCDRKCAEIWINETIGHRIICDCIKCGHNNKKCKTLAEVVGPETNAIASLSQEPTQDDD